MTLRSRSREIAPHTFFYLAMPAGVYLSGVLAILVPYLLRNQGVAVDVIARVVALASLPTVWCVLTTPIVDIAFRRRTWVLAMSAIGAGCTYAAILGSYKSLRLTVILLFAGTEAVMLASAAGGALRATLVFRERGKGAGWWQAGSLGGGSLLGGAMIFGVGKIPSSLLALMCAIAVFLGALPVLWIDERQQPLLPVGAAFSKLYTNIVSILRSRRTLCTGILFASPCGAFAIGNLISGLAADYHSSPALVALVTGVAGGVLMGLGGMAGGWVSDLINRFKAYVGFCLLGALAACLLWLGTPTPLVLTVGYLTYAFTNGLSNAAFSALITDAVGGDERGTATAMALLNAVGSIPVIYMTWLDGVGYKYAGHRGLMATDALISGFAAFALLIAIPHFTGRFAGFDDPGLGI